MPIAILSSHPSIKSKLAEVLTAKLKSPLIKRAELVPTYEQAFSEEPATFGLLKQNAAYAALYLRLWEHEDHYHLVSEASFLSLMAETLLLANANYFSLAEARKSFAIAKEHCQTIKGFKHYIFVSTHNTRDDHFLRAAQEIREMIELKNTDFYQVYISDRPTEIEIAELAEQIIKYINTLSKEGEN